jgi:signal transduction histidine kinase
MQLFRNREVKLMALVFIILFVLFAASFMYIANMWINTANTVNIKQNIGAVGTLVKEYPEFEDKIVKSFTIDYKENYEYGSKALKKYSYDECLPVYKNAAFLENYGDIYRMTIGTIIVFGIIFFVFLLVTYNRIFKKLRVYSNNAEMIVEGSYTPDLTDREEGDFGLLRHQFNVMAERLKDNMEALREEKLSLKKLITDISHQLKTPLASLVMFNDIMLRDSDMPTEDRKKFLQESKNQMDRIEWLFKNLLKMAKLEGRIVDFKKEAAPIYDTILRSMQPLKLMAFVKNINISLHGDKDILVKHDVNWSTEAFSNIIKNCIEHSKEGGQINISWEDSSIFTQVAIEDNGLGIKREELPKIFDRFYKGPNSNNPTNIGIGLYIAKTIFEGQNGSVYAYSEEGKGTRFVITFMKGA